MVPGPCSEHRVAGTVAARCRRRVLAPLLGLALAACGGGSSSGGGTQDSPFVGTYQGSTTVSLATADGDHTGNEGVTIVVNPDGLVQFGDARSTIYASGPLKGNTIRIDADAAALVAPDCTGTITLAGTFQGDAGDSAGFDGHWTSRNVSCFGVAGTVSGPVSAARSSAGARASRVFETSNPVLLRLFRQAAG